MEMNVMHESKMVEIWLTKAEKNDPVLKERLKDVYREYSQKKYQVVVFESGEKELKQSVLDLLAYNKKRLAELQVQKEKAANPNRPTSESLLEQLRAPLPSGKARKGSEMER